MHPATRLMCFVFQVTQLCALFHGGRMYAAIGTYFIVK